MKAADPDGMANTATVSITVGDINDKNPEFLGLPYSFRVNEGQKDAIVGTVKVSPVKEEWHFLIYKRQLFYELILNSRPKRRFMDAVRDDMQVVWGDRGGCRG